MHYVAGALLLAQYALIWVLKESVDVEGLEYLAWIVWLVAVALIIVSMLTLLSRGRVPDGRSYVETEALVATGAYALIRHAQYLGWMLMYVAMFLFKANWVLVAVGVLGVACVYWFARQEEQFLIGEFGEPYRRYMQKVPRFNLMAGAIRLIFSHCVEEQGAA